MRKAKSDIEDQIVFVLMALDEDFFWKWRQAGKPDEIDDLVEILSAESHLGTDFMKQVFRVGLTYAIHDDGANREAALALMLRRGELLFRQEEEVADPMHEKFRCEDMETTLAVVNAYRHWQIGRTGEGEYLTARRLTPISPPNLLMLAAYDCIADKNVGGFAEAKKKTALKEKVSEPVTIAGVQYLFGVDIFKHL